MIILRPTVSSTLSCCCLRQPQQIALSQIFLFLAADTLHSHHRSGTGSGVGFIRLG